MNNAVNNKTKTVVKRVLNGQRGFFLRRRRRSTSSTSSASAGSLKIQSIPMTEVKESKNILENGFSLLSETLLNCNSDKEEPVVFRQGCIDSKAVTKWSDIDYLRHRVGEETGCRVEIYNNHRGDHGYADPSTLTSEVAFGDYMDYMELVTTTTTHVDDGYDQQQELVYLAQNELFSSLKSDLSSAFNYFDKEKHLMKLHNVMLWLGPAGCITPLHFDPLDNLYMQISGEKRIFIYPPTLPTEEDFYYSGFEGRQHNTSAVNILKPCYKQFPSFADAPEPYFCILYPGDILFIPAKWWHHVTSLKRSGNISVNFWFKK